MPTIKYSLKQIILLALTIVILSACVDENNPPGCEEVETPALTQTTIDVDEGSEISIQLPSPPDESTTIEVYGPDNKKIQTYNTTIENAKPENAGVYKIYFVRNYCKSKASEVNVNVNPLKVKCTIPNDCIRFPSLGRDYYYSVYCGKSVSSGKFSMQGNGFGSDCEIFFGTASAPKAPRSFPITSESLTFMGADEVSIRVLISGQWYYASYADNNRLIVTLENGKLVASFCDMKFTGSSTTLIGSGRLICN